MKVGQLNIWGEPATEPRSVAQWLDENHYLGASFRGVAYSDDFGVMVFATPTSRRLPPDRWFELVRWCLAGEKNAGSRQWKAARCWLLEAYPQITTVVSYSDPSVGHTGALYRACNWLWAPTWHRLRPPPTGNGSWSGGPVEAVKDRWVAPLRPDPERESLLRIEDESLRRRFPAAEYREPLWRGGRPLGGGGNFKSWQSPEPHPPI